MRLSDEFIAKVDAWAQAHGTGRSEAIRRLVETGLKAKK
jgi:metal-responsive CopG/Arc/MetJ family transcriptional regulator